MEQTPWLAELPANTELVPWNFGQVDSEHGQKIILNSLVTTLSGHLNFG